MRSPKPTAVLELLKPITLFAPMWAFTCVVVSSGLSTSARWSIVPAGIALAGPLKAIEVDTRLGVRSLPVHLRAERAARLACIVMAAPQILVIGLLVAWNHSSFATVVAALLCGQLALMPRILRDPRGQATAYNDTRTTLYFLGRLTSALAPRSAGVAP